MSTRPPLDRDALRDFAEWRRVNGDDSLLSYLYGAADLEVAVTFTAPFWPDTVASGGGVFLRHHFSADAVARWSAASGGNMPDVQRSMNRTVLGDVMPGVADMSDGNLPYLAEVLADMWDSRLAKQHPGRQFRVVVYEVHLNYAVTFAAVGGTAERAPDASLSSA